MRWLPLLFLPALLMSMSGKAARTTYPVPASCTVSLSEGDDTLVVDDMVFANFFSPNGDGHNDTYIILNVENHDNNSLKVFNRWGEVVYQASPYRNDWDGTSNTGNTFKGKRLPDGVYFFEFYDGHGTIATGKLTMKR